ncbi:MULTISPECIES: hypothetical protein [Leptolyngbya]|jgi:hypothetical protein|nr:MULTISPECIES: hypothetical protein [Leptolyngbya]MBD2370602.1 hypothetical protein [Leptolyngbya sp. FACHB-161]MBD2377022.1 hypothetical protein [Leptolyngbya sp. FACHB-238]MBD2401382.1 hypothetical protein [Leptolyngbya sp. FACHB-239]MCY6493948.1 hypothetical protein [Leptolyngbya sp. GGD]ULP33566.1 hypothetical protein MCP04_32860 [Leptolyngbya boryana IU 594]
MTLVIMSPHTVNVREKVREMLAPFYSDLNVEPYREYLDQKDLLKEIQYLSTLSQQEVEELARKWEVPHDDIETLAKLNLDWYDDEVTGVDENGFYRMTTINPLGKWDSYESIEAEPGEDTPAISYPCLVLTLPPVIPYAIVTPDGKWYEAGSEVGIQTLKRSLLNANDSETPEEAAWGLTVREILARYSDHIVTALNCHI